jgi:hypothetical protein
MASDLILVCSLKELLDVQLDVGSDLGCMLVVDNVQGKQNMLNELCTSSISLFVDGCSDGIVDGAHFSVCVVWSVLFLGGPHARMPIARWGMKEAL